MYHKIKRRFKLQKSAGNKYEFYIKWLLTKDGWEVEHTGRLGFDDHGIDLIARKAGVTRYIQCKGWSWWKLLHEDVVNQLYGAVVGLEGTNRIDNGVELYIYSPAKLTEFAQSQADHLHIHFERKGFPRWKRRSHFRHSRRVFNN